MNLWTNNFWTHNPKYKGMILQCIIKWIKLNALLKFTVFYVVLEHKFLNNYLICHTCFYDCFKAVRIDGLETIDIFMSENNGIKVDLQSEIRKSNYY